LSGSKVSAKSIVKSITPPVFVDLARRLIDSHSTTHDWEYVPEGWREGDAAIKGWNDVSILNRQVAGWPAFVRSVEDLKPIGMASSTDPVCQDNYCYHNTIMSYAYALMRAACKKDGISLLDWGGGIGQYYLISQALLPGVNIDYHCKELPILCKHGRELHPRAHFYDTDETALVRKYDLVLASSSLHYSHDWIGAFARLAAVADPYVYVTRIPVANVSESFVVVQRPYRYGYDTEYLGWFLNRKEFLGHAASLGLELVREFLIQERPAVYRAPEQCDYRGFLFQRSDRRL
jgi:putative methyltransferase (TIGR04325 family)